MSENNFTHLHVHTEYSLLDGLSRIPELVKKAKDLGMKALAITDHGVLFGAIHFYNECIKQGIKPIIGSEVYIASRNLEQKEADKDSKNYHLVLLAKNETGYKNLMKIVSKGFVDGFYRRPRVDHKTLKKYSEGIIALSGCLSGEIPKAILENDLNKAHDLIIEYQEIFGEENFYLEIQNHRIHAEARVREALTLLSEQTGAGLVATNDVHYVNKNDSAVHDVLVCIQTGAKVNDVNRMRYEPEQFYLKTKEEMITDFKYYPGAIENTQKIVDQIDLKFENSSNHMPVFKVPEEFNSADEYLRFLCERGLKERYESVTPELKERLDNELSVISSMGFSNYFLVVWDFIDFARKSKIPVGPGRGSAAGSLVAYTLGITSLDPIKYSLQFERFLNPERYSMPDIDCDFCYERRQEVIDYVTEKYGADHVAQIITFGTMAARGSIRDVGRVLDVSYNKTDYLAKQIPMRPGSNITIEDALSENSKLRELNEKDSEVTQVLKTAREIEGLSRHASTHAAGVVISDKPLNEYVPLYRNGDLITTQFPMDLLESQGLIKMDFLGLKTLTVIHDAVKNIKHSKGEIIDIENINLNDHNIFQMISSGDTGGVFQLESSGMINFMKELKPQNFEDIIAGISLFRPGPMEQIPTYIKNKQEPEKISYLHPLLKPILETTYGCLIYQEQVIQIFRDLAGFSMGRGDLIRRAMSKKKTEIMEKEGNVFINGELDESGEIVVEGALRRGVNQNTAQKILDQIKEFAHYAFNKSHAACYALIGYQTAWLKYYYPEEFYAALLSSVMDSSKRISRYIEESRRRGIKIKPPNINESYSKFVVRNNEIIYGLKAIKNVGEGLIDEIIESRERLGPFTSLLDFCQRVTKLNKRALISLIKAGALDFLNIERGTLLVNAFSTLSKGNELSKIQNSGQTSFLQRPEIHTNVLVEMEKAEPLSLDEKLGMEKEVLGLYLSGHPLRKYESLLEQKTTFNFSVTDTYEDISAAAPDQSYVYVGGLLTDFRLQKTKNNETMAFARLEDQYGSIDLVVFPKDYDTYRDLLIEDAPLLVYGKLCYDEENNVSVCANEVQLLSKLALEKNTKPYLPFTDSLNVDKNGLIITLSDISKKSLITQIKKILQTSPGKTPVVLYFKKENKRFKASNNLNVEITNELMERLNKLLDRGKLNAC